MTVSNYASAANRQAKAHVHTHEVHVTISNGDVTVYKYLSAAGARQRAEYMTKLMESPSNSQDTYPIVSVTTKAKESTL